jgi:hypothetical protein
MHDRAVAIGRIRRLWPRAEHDEADGRRLGHRRVAHGDLFVRGALDPAAELDHVAHLVRPDSKAAAGRIDQAEPVAAPGDVDRQRTQPIDLERMVEMQGEARHELERDPLAPALSALGFGHHQAGGSVERARVVGSCITSMPVSSSTVTMHIAFEPDVG